MIPYGKQSISEDDIKEVVASLKSDFLTTGPRVAEFERRFAKTVGAKYAVAVSSGTAALHLACLAAGIGPGDEVITTPLTFLASANCALYCGAKPVFADIDEYGLIDPKEIRKASSSRVKAIIPVHYAGLPCDMKNIGSIAKDLDAIVIEDACHALGATYEKRPIGACTYSDMACFSLHPVKHITTGEGGVVTTNSKRLYERLKRLRNHGISPGKEEIGPWHREMTELGFNYRITDIQCALGISQLGRLDQFLKARRMIASRYRQAFSKNPSIMIPKVPKDRTHAFHLFPIRVPAALRKSLFMHLQKADIRCQVHYMPVYLNPYYLDLGYKQGMCPKAEEFYSQEISIPMYPSLTSEEQEEVISAISEFF